jgi:hypothetical protein
MSVATCAPIVEVGGDLVVVVERRLVLVDHGRRWYSLEAGAWFAWHRAPRRSRYVGALG